MDITCSTAAGKGISEEASLHVNADLMECLILQIISCLAGQKTTQ